jgi:hypothetical protein
MDLTETLCDDGLWTKLPRDRVQWWTLVLVALNPRVLLLSEYPVKMSLQLFIFLIPLNVGNTQNAGELISLQCGTAIETFS